MSVLASGKFCAQCDAVRMRAPALRLSVRCTCSHAWCVPPPYTHVYVHTLHAARCAHSSRRAFLFLFRCVVFSCVCVLQLCGGRDLMLDDKGKLLEHISASHMSCSTSHMHMHMHMSIHMACLSCQRYSRAGSATWARAYACSCVCRMRIHMHRHIQMHTLMCRHLSSALSCHTRL